MTNDVRATARNPRSTVLISTMGLLQTSALTIALAIGFTAAPFALSTERTLEVSSAQAKSDKAKSKSKSKNRNKGSRGSGGKKSGGASGSGASAGNAGSGDGSRGRSGSLRFGGDGQQITSTGRGRGVGRGGNATNWSSAATTNEVRGRGNGRGNANGNVAAASVNEDTATEETETLEEIAKLPSAPVRAYTKLHGLNQGEVASLLKSWNGMNGLQGNLEGKLEKMEDNPNSLHSAQLAYLRDSALSGDALKAFVDLGGDPDAVPSESDFAIAEASLDADALTAAQEYLDAQDKLATPEGLSEDEIAALNDVLSNYEGEDPEAVVAMAESGEAEDLIAQYDAWNTYQEAEAGAVDSFLAASRSYGGEIDDATLEEMRSLVDAIAEMSGITEDVTDYFEIGSEEGESGGEGEGDGGDTDVSGEPTPEIENLASN